MTNECSKQTELWCHDRFGRFFSSHSSLQSEKKCENSPDKTIVMSSTRAPRFNNLRWGKLFAFISSLNRRFSKKKNKTKHREPFCANDVYKELTLKWRGETRLDMDRSSWLRLPFTSSRKWYLFPKHRLRSVVCTFFAPRHIRGVNGGRISSGIKDSCSASLAGFVQHIRKEQPF